MSTISLRQFVLFAATFLTASLSAQVRINEVMAQNNSGLTDPDYGESADWMELYNAGKEEVNLGGYFITDNLDVPAKYVLPATGIYLIRIEGQAYKLLRTK